METIQEFKVRSSFLEIFPVQLFVSGWPHSAREYDWRLEMLVSTKLDRILDNQEMGRSLAIEITMKSGLATVKTSSLKVFGGG